MPAMNDKQKTALAAGAAVLAVGVLVYLVWGAVARSAAAPDSTSRVRTMMCAETGEVIVDMRIAQDATPPLANPKTGRKTLYPPETCFWNRDGTAKVTPTYVLLNTLTGKTGKTMCPDCGREVVFHNPAPPTDLLIEAGKKK
ncbi:MAG: hypothetical protein HRU70_14165 [Phycisphaeraceae bacterium]|nr:MAG: hypothetical protein HRU70_14165 [Phycisphaeraceae bacterium]